MTPRQGFFSTFPHGTMLYRTWIVFKVRSWWLPHSRTDISVRYSGYFQTCFTSHTGLSPSLALLSRRLLVCKRRCKESPNTTSPYHFWQGFSLPYAAFGRSYSRHLYWFLFLPVLRRFNSRGSLSLTDFKVKSHSEILGSKVTCTSPRHNVACHVLHRQSKPSHPPNSVSRNHTSMIPLSNLFYKECLCTVSLSWIWFGEKYPV